jgi:D-aminoacyl-tRNA deacylase
MRAVIQRVTNASVTIDNVVTSKINKGVLILLGIENDDDYEDISWLSKKISQLRIFNDKEGIMNLSVLDIDGEVLVISQFTLHAKTKKGNRPSYINAAPPEIAIPLYEIFVTEMGKHLKKEVSTGKFGAMMDVGFTNSGPVTIIIDTKNKE